MAHSDDQRERIAQIIKDHHLAFRVEVLGPASIPKQELDRLVKAGVVKLPKKAKAGRSMVSIPAAHQLGALAAQTSEKTIERLSNDEFWKYIKHAPPKLTEHERAAINACKDVVGDHITRLGERIAADYTATVREESAKARRASMLATVKREVAEGIVDRKGAKAVAAKLKKATKDAQRDWLRVAHTELHNAFEEGKAQAIITESGGNDPLVFKRPRPDACPYCKLLYLDGKKPRLFRLSVLIANGTTNAGRRAKRPTLKGPNATEYKAVLGAVHPWCQCTLHVMPDGFVFDKDGNMVYKGVKKSTEDALPANIAALLRHKCA